MRTKLKENGGLNQLLHVLTAFALRFADKIQAT